MFTYCSEMDAPTLLPEYGPRQTAIRAALEVAAHLLFYASAALLVGLVILYYFLGAALWVAVLALPYLPGFLLKCALVIAAILGAAGLFPLADAAWNAVPFLQDYWPLVLAAAVPVPLAVLIDRVFFR
ncbi:MAG: hypothetical protein RLO80_05330 [Hyphomonas sp.]